MTPGAPTSAADTATEDDEGTIIVTGQKPRGSVVGDIPPENVLTSRDIRATGATSIAELLDSIAAQTGSARGRTSGPPVLLLNGLRISGFRELRDLPPEAIERLEILPEEVALKYGYSADQRVVNIVLRRRFDSTGTEVGGTLATDGGYAAGKADATRLIIADGRRTSLNLHLEGNNPLYESERNILLDPASTAADARAYRTLVGAQQSARVTGTLNRTLGRDIGATITAELGRIHSRSRFGIDPFNAANPLTRNSTSDSAGLGAVLNAQRGKWRLSSTANADFTSTRTDSDRSLPLAPSDDYSRSKSRSLGADATATGPLLALPAGDATATFKLGLTRLDLDSRSRRVGVNSQANLGRTIGDGSVSLDLPLTRGPSAIGRLTGNLNAGVSQLSDFGTLTSLGGGLNWSPKGNLSLIGSATREEGAPTLSQLGDPLVSTGNVPYFDAVRGESVSVTTVTGGNAALAADRRTVWKLGGNWQPSQKLDLRLRADFVHQSIDRPQIGFPAVTPALEAAFPGRFVRDGSGQLVQVDLRPVNADSSRRDTLRWGFDFSKPLKSRPPTREQINALRALFGQPALTGSPAGGASSGGARFDGPRGGGGRGGGRFGGRTGGRLTLSVTHTVTLTDELVIAPGIAKLDYLRGEALSSTGGRSRHQVEVETGYYNNGVGARVEANWRSATRVNGGLTGQDLRFSDYATIDLRLFANLGERLSLVSKSPFFLGSSLRFEVKNLFDSRPQVRGGSGAIPFAYQPDRLEPIGRTVGISFRKLFLPTRLFRFGGGPSGGGGPPRN
ncbi:MAG: TonB-dependent receptor plug domain-containing protein [Sphingomicrobium sp.]